MRGTRRRLAAALALAALAFVVTANLVVLASGGAPPSAARRASGPDAPAREPLADCALVLGAAVRDDGTPSDMLRDRLDEALAVWRAGRVKRILVSGDHRVARYDEPNTMRRYLEAHGVPPSVIFMDHAGLDTYSSVWRARHVFGAASVVVVTQRFHLSRAVWVSRALGMQAEGSPADRHLYRSIAWLQAREIASRTKAVLDVTVGREPRHGADSAPIDLTGDGRVTSG
jgi:vancomycin permeability regulator SanA